MDTTQATDWREVRRCRAWELKQQGWSQRDIATALGVTEGAVSQWLKLARTKGPTALAAQPRTGRPSQLTPKQKAAIPKLLLKGAQAHGFRGDLWTRARVAVVLQREFGVKHCEQHVGTLLKACGWSCQKPMRRATQRDEAAIRKWPKGRWRSLKKSETPGKDHRSGR